MTNKKGGMKKRVTRFADLENEEFARDHATYADAPVPVADQEAATTPARGRRSEEGDEDSLDLVICPLEISPRYTPRGRIRRGRGCR